MQIEHNIKILKTVYREKKPEIEKKLDIFRKTGTLNNKKIFAELCFCILTPQSRAVMADRAIKKLIISGRLFNGTKDQISKDLTGVRFQNNKASYIVLIREYLDESRTGLKKYLKEKDIQILRDKLVALVKGYGLKEASHFLRNTGKGDDIAILDRHILKELVKFEVIRIIPKNLSRKIYLNIECKMRDFSRKINIPLDVLDLLFWYQETGYFFK